jgi:CheY-like chemotaxis protein
MVTKILICEDAAFVSEVLHYQLEELGYEVIGVAEDGEEAVVKALSLKPDLILLDLVLPRRSGLEVAQALQEQGFQGAIVGLSTLEPSSLRPKMIAAGIHHFLPKPFTKDSLREVLQQAFTARGVSLAKSG